MSQSSVGASRKWPACLRRGLASAYLQECYGIQLAPATLAKLASVGGGPKFLKDGKFPLYPTDHLDEFAAARLGPLRANTSASPPSRHRESPHGESRDVPSSLSSGEPAHNNQRDNLPNT